MYGDNESNQAGKRPISNTSQRIFGNSAEENRPKPSARQSANDDKIVIEAERSHEIETNKQPIETSLVSNLNRQELHQIAHGIRYSSFMDQDLSNNNRIQEQKMQQKQWLDQQISERKSRDQKAKQTEKLIDESNSKRFADSSDNNNKKLVDQREIQNEIREYNMKMANDKRNKEKMEKENDKKEFGDQQQKREDRYHNNKGKDSGWSYD